jgi:hypothetical protein
MHVEMNDHDTVVIISRTFLLRNINAGVLKKRKVKSLDMPSYYIIVIHEAI